MEQSSVLGLGFYESTLKVQVLSFLCTSFRARALRITINPIDTKSNNPKFGQLYVVGGEVSKRAVTGRPELSIPFCTNLDVRAPRQGPILDPSESSTPKTEPDLQTPPIILRTPNPESPNVQAARGSHPASRNDPPYRTIA